MYRTANTSTVVSPYCIIQGRSNAKQCTVFETEENDRGFDDYCPIQPNFAFVGCFFPPPHPRTLLTFDGISSRWNAINSCAAFLASSANFDFATIVSTFYTSAPLVILSTHVFQN